MHELAQFLHLDSSGEDLVVSDDDEVVAAYTPSAVCLVGFQACERAPTPRCMHLALTAEFSFCRGYRARDRVYVSVTYAGRCDVCVTAELSSAI